MRDAGEDDALLEQVLLRLEREVGPELDTWGAAEREDVLAAERKASAGERAEAVQAFEKLARRGATPLPGRRLVLVAAAALLGGVLFGWIARGALERAPERADPFLLGDEAERALTPVGLVDRYDRFAWTAPPGSGQLYGLRVWSGGGFEAVLRVDGLTEPVYEPKAEEEALLGAEIRWEAVLQDAGGGTIGHVVSASAARRSR